MKTVDKETLKTWLGQRVWGGSKLTGRMSFLISIIFSEVQGLFPSG